MNGILISVQPQHVMNILNRDKILEIRKTIPKCELPCKVCIYCTKGKDILSFDIAKQKYALNIKNGFLNGRVVAEFTLNKIDKLEYRHLSVSHTNAYIPVSTNADYQWEKHCCVDYNSIVDYGKFAPLYAWHIDDLKIYNKPKELSEFVLPNKKNCKTCFFYKDMCENVCEEIKKHLFRPPQSWCYVEINNESI